MVHGGGLIDGYAGSNSLEAVNASYEAGHRTLELDLLLSSDGVPVCLHDWSMYYSNDITDGVPMTLEAFRAVRIFERYTPLDLETLAEWLTAHPDVQIITDVKDNNLGVLRTSCRRASSRRSMPMTNTRPCARWATRTSSSRSTASADTATR